jgi:hypothetical protein
VKAVVVLAALLVAAAIVSGAGAQRAVSFCKGAQLSGTFAVVPNSQGAGNVVYRLTLRNRSTTACSVSGLPVVRLLAKSGEQLATRVVAAQAGTATAALVTLAPGKDATATARFSPDVPGRGEPTSKACEPTAARLRVAGRGGGATIVRIVQPTPVCEHGQLQFSLYTRA